MTAPVASVATSPTPHFEPDRERGVETAEINDLDFWDLLDIINPLQHLPIVSTIYRALTGDTIKPAMNILGGALYGGPVGLLAAYASAVVEQNTGREPLPNCSPWCAAKAQHHRRRRRRSWPLNYPRPGCRRQSRSRAVAGASAPAGPPPWLSAALDEAKNTREHGQTPSWLVDAIAGGLAKYAKLAEERKPLPQP